jgi:hypothetical protein
LVFFVEIVMPKDGDLSTDSEAPRVAVAGIRRGMSATAHLVALAIVACVLEGAGRKWLAGNGGVWSDALFYFSKDFLLALSVMVSGSFRTRPSRQLVGLWNALAATAVVIVAMGAWNLDGSPVLGAFLSVRSIVVLPALALALSRRLRSYRDIELILWTVGVLAVVNAATGALQYYLPGEHFVNKQVTGGNVTESVGRIRAHGTFSYITGMADMAVMGSWAGCVLLLKRPIPKFAYLFTVAALICPLAALSRSGLVFSLGLLTSVLVFSKGGFRAALPLAGLCIALGLFLSTREEDSARESHIVNGIMKRHKESDSFAERAGGIWSEISRATVDNPLGTGLGAGQIAARIDLEGGVRQLRGFESEPGRIIYEIGMLGWTAVLFFRLWILGVLWKSSMRTADGSDWFGNVRKASMVALAMFFAMNTAFDHVASFLAWIVAASALATIEIEWSQRITRGVHTGDDKSESRFSIARSRLELAD